MSKILLFNKPFQVLTQFTSDDGKATLADYIDHPGFYAAGRLDYDSEGLLILTDEGPLQHYLANPKFKMEKTYWAQVEGAVTEEALSALRKGVELKDGMTRPAKAQLINEPDIWERNPPIRERKNIPTSWIELKISEGKNRQVRRMTAAVGFPTLRLIRYAIGEWTIDQLQQGESQLLDVQINIPKKPSSPSRRSTKHSNSSNRHNSRHNSRHSDSREKTPRGRTNNR
ncbi:rRNA large subunit pseudouridine synthase E [Neptuniibacter sp.]|uniref:rRNA large subunit pseudouridine synthase E n=1 Tax=Neptuniibacter sp. TaxID=1962643 RepID=UPI00262B84DD|nr:rRNA large subunit pseudouridine synthase E [Neptuniibacter sp.]MCP4595311.1 rRNA large subunit pseudouridine synthase E [Neptuniibacter sp.]